MKGTLRLGRMFEIPVKIHWSFFLLPAWAVGSGLYNGMTWKAAAWFLAYIAALFVCVILHEFGHILMARRFGVGTQDVILTPIGGMARLNRMPEKPMSEFAVSIAGPLVNVGIIALLSPALLHAPMGEVLLLDDANVLFGDSTYFIRILILANAMLVGFNLIPAFPLDGGRILRAGLAYKFGRRRGTRIAAIVGKTLAVGFFGLGIYLGAVSLVLIGIFVFTMAGLEYRAIAKEAFKRETTVGEVIHTDFTKVYPDTPVREVFRELSLGAGPDFVVIDPFHVPVGIINEAAITEALRQNELDAPCERYMLPPVTHLTRFMSLEEADFLIKRSGMSMLPVVDNGQMTGCLSRENIRHFLKFKSKFGKWLN